MLNNFVNLENKLKGNLLTDKFSRGLYATDASIYQINPHAVVKPYNKNDIFETIKFAKSEGVSILSRGGGTSQCGQTVNRSIVIDNSKFLNKIKTIQSSLNVYRYNPKFSFCQYMESKKIDQLNLQ